MVPFLVSKALDPYLPESPNIGDFGAGEGYFYPLRGKMTRANLTAIEPSTEAVLRGIAMGRFPKDVKIVGSYPPYNQIAKGSLDGVVGFSSFHELDEGSLRLTLKDINTRLKPSGVLAGFQEIDPQKSFLQNISRRTLSQVEAQVEAHLRASLNSTRIGEGIWQAAYLDTANDVSESISINEGGFTKSIYGLFHPELWENSSEFADMLGLCRKGKRLKVTTADEINNYITQGNHNGLKGTYEAERKIIRLIAELPDSLITSAPFSTYVMMHIMAFMALNQKIYESYLSTVFESSNFSIVEKGREAYFGHYPHAPANSQTRFTSFEGGGLIEQSNDQSASILLPVKKIIATPQ